MNDWTKIDLPIALYGLAANPPHAGHWSCVDALISQGYKVLMAPSISHAFGKRMVDFNTRVDWLNRASVDFGVSDLCLVWPIEAVIASERTCGDLIYSIDVLDRARVIFGGDIKLAVGPDNAAKETFSRFRDAQRILSQYGLVVVPEVDGIRSTMIRDRLAVGDATSVELVSWVGLSIAKDIAKSFSFVKKEAIIPCKRKK
jgi:nicotinate-nucleotide adenylyltransferase